MIMKKLLAVIAFSGILFGSAAYAQQDKSNRPSPPANVSTTLSSGTTITIDYSRPSLKSRTIGKDIAPFDKVWRTGANEATTFEVDKNVTVEGKNLAAGKYSLYTIPGENEWTIIFNKSWKEWGTAYKQAEDVLRVNVKPQTTIAKEELLTFKIDPNGTVSILWGTTKVDFKVK